MNAAIAKALLKVAPLHHDTWYTTEYLADAITREYDIDDGALTSTQLSNTTSRSSPFNTGVWRGEWSRSGDRRTKVFIMDETERN
jgi:hypothetical protein